MAPPTDGRACILAIDVLAAGPTPGPVGALITDGGIAITSNITKELADPALAFRANGEGLIIAMVIAGALRALTPIAAGPAERFITTTAPMALEKTRLALALVALALTWLITIRTIAAAHAEDPKGLHRTEGRRVTTAFVIGRITARTRAFDTEGRKAIITIILVSTGDAARIAVSVALAERRFGTTAGMIGDITGLAEGIDALTALRRAIPIGRTGDAFGTIIPIETHRRLIATAPIAPHFAYRTASRRTGRGLIGTVSILGTGRTADPAHVGHTKWGLAPAARIIG